MSKRANLEENRVIFPLMTFSYLPGIDRHVNVLKKQLNENSDEKVSSVQRLNDFFSSKFVTHRSAY